MPIWAVANIVRKMSHLEVAESCAAGHAALEDAAANKDPKRIVTRQTAESTESNRLSDKHRPVEQLEPNHLDEMETLAEHTPPTGSEFVDVMTHTPHAGKSRRERGNHQEVAFQFDEVEECSPLSAYGHTPSTETLEIDLGTTHMGHDEAERLQHGAVVALRESVEEEVTIRNGERVIAKGMMAIVDGKIAVRISETFG